MPARAGSTPKTSRIVRSVHVWVTALALCGASLAAADTPVAVLTLASDDDHVVTRSYAGTVVPQRQSALGFRYGGEVRHVAVDRGDHVGGGDLLAVLDTANLEAGLAEAEADLDHATAQMNAARAHVTLAKQTESRFRRLVESGHGSEQRYDEHRLALRARQAEYRVAEASRARATAQLQSARIAIDDAEIRAPYAGIVQHRHVDEGTQIAPGQTVLVIIETTRMEVQVGLPEQFASVLEPGRIYPINWRTQELPGQLKAVLPELDPVTQTLTAIFEITDAPQIPFGSTVELDLERRIPGSGFWIPTTALSESTRGLWSVLVLNHDSVLERRLVEVMHAEADQVFVRGTLHVGERVVRTGVQRVVPGQRVTLARADAPADA